MRLLHLSDLHLGRRLCEADLFEDQKYILDQIVSIALSEGVQGVLVAGDVYDKSVPGVGAVNLWDHFLTALCEHHLPVWAISGNHDSAERLAFGGRLLEHSGVHLASVFDGRLSRFDTRDEHGPLAIWALPFVRPAAVRAFLPDEAIENYTDAAAALVRAAAPDTGGRNILIAHQFVTAGAALPAASGSELLNLGTLDNVDASAFDLFDYAALGHIHAAQSVGREEVRYCGSPLAYSVSEALGQKSVTVVDVGPKGQVRTKQVPLSPLRPLRRVQGPLEALLQSAVPSNDYIYARLTDQTPPLDPAARLRSVYPNLVRLEFVLPNVPETGAPALRQLALRTPRQLFEEFYRSVHGRELDDEEKTFLDDVLGEEAEG
ncbi:MAG TPA: exonuclease SbcCD subunit D [Candidatus Fournierella excrementigallinarum]|nr:exonuclease SbcCD subunit D [Candidatus Fournierella excrementigallinarum]